jgi:deoxycytidine triphosphate deaminase
MADAHDWKYVDPDGSNASRKGLLLSNQITKFCSVKLLIADQFRSENLRPAAYTLRIGAKYVDSNGKPGTLGDKNPYFEMQPNSIVYVSTHEKLDLPYYIAARFNLRVKWVYKGILLGTGPQVEPGYRGFLSCPLYNLTDKLIRINYLEDFATIDFERTTDFCPGASADEIEASKKSGNELDTTQVKGQNYLLFRTWRHIGIAFAVSFFALTLTLLSFGSNVFRQVSDLANENKAIRLNLQKIENTATLAQSEVDRLKDKVTVLEKASQPKPAKHP